jgi:uncharacterized protein
MATNVDVRFQIEMWARLHRGGVILKENREASGEKGPFIGSFLLLAFGWSWVFWTGASAAGGIDTGLGILLLILGGFGPSIAAVILVVRAGGEAPRDLVSRAVAAHRMRPAIALLAVALPVVLMVLAELTAVASGAAQTVMEVGIVGAISAAATSLFLGPLAEELGWRGYALEPLQDKFGPATASAMLGLIWTAWHLPLFFVAGTVQEQMGLGIAGLGVFTLMTVADTYLMTALYNRTDRSVLSAILFHWGKDWTSDVFVIVPFARAIRALLAAAIALVLVVGGLLRPTPMLEPRPA